MINYNKKTFRPFSNSESGEVSSETTFRFTQKGNLVSAEYEGGEIVFGTLIAVADADGVLDMRYQHVNRDGVLMTGMSMSTPEVLSDGRIRIHDKWQWTCGDRESGESILEEVLNAEMDN